MSAATCPNCGSSVAPSGFKCAACGTALRPRPTARFRTNVYIDERPLELWLVIALFAVPGVYLVQASLRFFPNLFDLWDVALFSHRFVLFLIVLLVYVLALGLAFCAITFMLYRLDPVGRGLAFVIVAADVTYVLCGDGRTTGSLLTMLLAVGGAALLAFSPAVTPLFGAQRHGHPNSVVAAKVALAVWIVLLAVTALLYLLLYDVNAKYPTIAAFFLVLSAGLVYVYRRRGLADRRSRLAITIAAGIAIVLYLAGSREPGAVLLIGLTAAAPLLLWLPADARAFYGDPPINWNLSRAR